MPRTGAHTSRDGLITVVDMVFSDTSGQIEDERLVFTIELGVTSFRLAYVVFSAVTPPYIVHPDELRCVQIDYTQLLERDVPLECSYDYDCLDKTDICMKDLLPFLKIPSTELPTSTKSPPIRTSVVQSALGVMWTEAKMDEHNERKIRGIYEISKFEAAAAWTFGEAKLTIPSDETFIIVNAGEITVGAATVTRAPGSLYPISLINVYDGHDSQLRGASSIGQRFNCLIRDALKTETLDKKNESIVLATKGFEKYDKPSFDLTRNNPVCVRIPGLKPDHEKGFATNVMQLKPTDIFSLFEEFLSGVKDVLDEHLALAKSRGCAVRKVIVTGTFAQSPVLSNFLNAYLDNTKIELVIPRHSNMVQIRGAVRLSAERRC